MIISILSSAVYGISSKTNYEIVANSNIEIDLDISINNIVITGNFLQPKWNVTVGGGQIMPVMGDIDNDGDQELVMGSAGSVKAVNGKTGVVEWSVGGSLWYTGVELIDLDNDGTPEVLHAKQGMEIRALNGNGSIRWTSPALGGEGFSLFPIVGYDIDGDGYPTIYVTTYDMNSPYEGAITMLDHEGNILSSSPVYKPCWGGPSLGDVNFDGEFEVYMGDRASWGGPSPITQGLRCWNAHTLECLWNRSDLYHSSASPVIVDVAGDGDLELVGHHQINNGCAVVDGMTGVTIPGMNYKGWNIPTHAKGTVYDIDEDGNMEFIASTSRSGVPKDFVVFDLVDGAYDFRPGLDYWIEWPPTVGDVTGDGHMEILVAMGDEEDTSDFPLLIYDKEFNLIQTVNITGAGQLTPARVYDCDSDGFNEVVVAGINGKLMVYDTSAPTPDPAPRTWVQFYSEYRRGAAEYIEPPGPKAPMIKGEMPADNSINVSLNPMLSVEIFDFQRDTFNVVFEIYDGSDWIVIQTYESQSVTSFTTFTADTTGYFDEYFTEYQWRVTAVDLQSNVNQKIFSFTTGSNPENNPPTSTDKTVTTDEDTIYTFLLSDFTFNDPDPGDQLEYVKITQLESDGSLKLNGIDVTLNQEISRANIIAGELMFTPDSDENGDPYTDFKFKVSDGIDYSVLDYTMTIDVTPVNDDPTAVDDVFDVDEDSGVSNFDVLANDFCAPDVGEVLTIVDVGVPDNGGVAVVVSGDPDTIDYVPADDFFGSEVFTYVIDDGNGGYDMGVVTVAVEDVNDDPILSGIVPNNESIGVERPPDELNVSVEDIDEDIMKICFIWRLPSKEWINLQTYANVSNGSFNTFNFTGNEWIWGNTTYTWSVNVTDGILWVNGTYQFTTGGSRYDVNNDGRVNFQDAGHVWINRTSEVEYDGIYDVNSDGQVNFQDAGIVWINRD